MKRAWDMFWFLLTQTPPVHLIWCGVLLAILLFLILIRRRWSVFEEDIRRYKRLCLLPLLLTTVHYVIFVAGASDFLRDYTPLYLIALLPLVLLLCAGYDKGFRIFAPIIGVMAVVFALRFCTMETNPHNFTRQSYTRSFHSFVQEMDRSYVLKEWKEIDFQALETKYMPLVEAAEQAKDPAAFADAVTMFCNELHDGHVSVRFDYDETAYHSAFQVPDYGLAMIRLDSGEVIAVCTEPEVNRLGIEDGTVITRWNGKPVPEAAEDVPDYGIPVKANADRLVWIDLSATGGDTAEVTFLDKAGTEQTVSLSAREDEHTLGEACDAFSHSTGSMRELLSENYSTKMLDEKCGYLLLATETTMNPLRDSLTTYTGSCPWAKKMFREKLRSLKAAGMEYLVIDLRNNMGGFGEVGYALCELLTDEDFYASGTGCRRNGSYIRISESRICGDGEFADLPVVALTNYNCISAGDSTALCLSRLPNVTLAGITDPNGSGQMTGGCCALSGAVVSVNYPIILTLNEQGEPDIDPRADRISRNPVEVRIPFDYDAAMQMFHDKEDYELAWAVAYLEGK